MGEKSMRPGPRDYEALEALFAQEINLATRPDGVRPLALLARLPKARIRRLEAMGLAESGLAQVGRDAFGPIEVPVCVLTALGHYAYCSWVSEQPEEKAMPDDRTETSAPATAPVVTEQEPDPEATAPLQDDRHCPGCEVMMPRQERCNVCGKPASVPGKGAGVEVTERDEWVVQRLRPGGLAWVTYATRDDKGLACRALVEGRASWGPDWPFRLTHRRIIVEETIVDGDQTY